MSKRLALVVLASVCLVGLANAQDDDGSCDSGSYTYYGSDGCGMGYCDQTLDPSSWDGVSQRFVDGWQPGALQQITAFDPSLADQALQLESNLENAIVSLANQETTFIDNTIAGVKANPAGAVAIAVDVALPLLGPEGLLLTGNISLDEALTVGSSPFSWNDWMMGLGTSLISSSLNNNSSSETIASALQGTGFALDRMKAADASAVALGAVGGAIDLAEQGRLASDGYKVTFPVQAIDPAVLNPIPINGVVPIPLSQAFLSSTTGNDTNESMDFSAIENWLMMQQMLANMNQGVAQSRSNSAAASGICPPGYMANPSAFAHMEAGLPPGANEYLCVPASATQSASMKPTYTATPSQPALSSPKDPTSAGQNAQTMSSSNSQSSPSTLCPNPAAIASVTGPAPGHNVTSASSSDCPGCVISQNAPSSYVPMLIPCSQASATPSAAIYKATPRSTGQQTPSGNAPQASPVQASNLTTAQRAQVSRVATSRNETATGSKLTSTPQPMKVYPPNPSASSKTVDLQSRPQAGQSPRAVLALVTAPPSHERGANVSSAARQMHASVGVVADMSPSSAIHAAQQALNQSSASRPLALLGSPPIRSASNVTPSGERSANSKSKHLALFVAPETAVRNVAVGVPSAHSGDNGLHYSPLSADRKTDSQAILALRTATTDTARSRTTNQIRVSPSANASTGAKTSPQDITRATVAQAPQIQRKHQIPQASETYRPTEPLQKYRIVTPVQTYQPLPQVQIYQPTPQVQTYHQIPEMQIYQPTPQVQTYIPAPQISQQTIPSQSTRPMPATRAAPPPPKYSPPPPVYKPPVFHR